MKNLRAWWLGLLISSVCVSGFAQGAPQLPPDPMLEIFEFPTNFTAQFGYSPLAYSNVFSVPVWRANALVLEMTNAEPAFLQDHLVETNGHTICAFPPARLFSLSRRIGPARTPISTGPAPASAHISSDRETGGQVRRNGFFGLSADLYGTNLSFWGMSNGVTTTYVNTAISWSSNPWHALDVEYSPAIPSCMWTDNWRGAAAG